ncbi:3'-5' exonuclease [Chitinispirillales bacterium ANBcel5]|uniref:ATP-dependent helicase n=1 Tax=Cellulosispirillum alkaliphilum TaxID=3039283 RepID=UPI002A50E679|nr:3'-5' exonuclease [Chitinispirillales bacterium ANBcel5]
MSKYTSGLNESQRDAVLYNEGPLLVIAGAGSGKTRVLTMRIARLVAEKRCNPEQILAVTFTNKAAKEMKERVASLTSKPVADKMTLCTFHSLGVRILREEGEIVGLNKNFTIIDEHERTSTLKSIMRAAGVRGLKNEDPNEFGTRISLAKNASLIPSEYKKENPEDRKLFRVYNSYNQILLKRQTVDFDDLLLLPLQIFRKKPEILKKYQQRFKFISIDEFQDTNAVQMKLATLLAFPSNNIMVVGDDDQGIYSWRGAEIQNIISFSSTFKGAKTVVLDKNYRSTSQILGGAHAVVCNNRIRKFKEITAVAGEGDPIFHYKADDEEDEAIWIAEKIKEHDKHTSFSYKDHAILLRTNAMTRRFEEELRRHRIPYKVSGAMSFYDRKEIKDILAYLRFFSNTDDELSLLRVLKVPSKGIVKSTIEKLDEMAAFRRMSLWDAMQRANENDKITPEQKRKIETFVELCNRYTTLFNQGILATSFRALLEECNYFELLKKAYSEPDELEPRLANIEEMFHGLEIYEKKHKRKTPTLSGYLQEIALLTQDEQQENEKDKNKGVILMTLHKSKGLEWPVVILAGLDREVMPSPRAVSEGKVEEERRLFYVGMTRAQKRLYLTYPGTKMFRGKMKQVTPCPFLREIPQEFLDGIIGEKQDEEKLEYLDSFFKEMQSKLSQTTSEELD